MAIAQLRQKYHQQICREIIRAPKGYPNFADGSNKSSRAIAWGIVRRLGCEVQEETIKEQTAGERFEIFTKDFLQEAFNALQHLRPGEWHYTTIQTAISGFEQYEHLADLEKIVWKNNELASVLGGDYIVKPDIVIGRRPVSDEEINKKQPDMGRGEDIAPLTPL